MKSIVVFCFLFIFTSFVRSSVAYTTHKARLYNLLQRPLRGNIDSSLLRIPNDKGAVVPDSNQESNFTEDDGDIRLRSDWDSGEHYYFQWAAKNRRPLEYLTGRKRETNQMIIPPRFRRINGGLWSSGLVG